MYVLKKMLSLGAWMMRKKQNNLMSKILGTYKTQV